MPIRNKIDGHWDEFIDWCKDQGVPIEEGIDGWGIWWACWNAALDAREEQEQMDQADGY